MKVTEESIVAKLLGHIDGLFSPPRHRHDSTLPKNTAIMRREYHAEGGFRWVSGKSSESERRAASRALALAEQEGLVKKLNPKASNSPYLQLTPYGEEFGRDRYTLFTCEECFEFVQHLASLQESSPEVFVQGPSVWVLENTLIGRRCDQSIDDNAGLLELERAGKRLASATKAGLVEARSNTRGNVFYRLTEKWFSEQPAGYQRIHPNLRIFDDELFDLYNAAYRDQREFMQSYEYPRAQDIGSIPLPASMRQRKDIVA